MAQLAIKGHPTRGREVIEILEMLGGINKYNVTFTETNLIYCLREDDNVIIATYPNIHIKHIFTIEKFLKKFPYKIGDRVRIPEYESEVCISNMYWDGNEVQYEVVTDEVEWYSAKELNKFNEPNKEKAVEKEKNNWAKWDLPEGYEFQDKEGNVINTDVIKLVKKQPQYPKTYEECCTVLQDACMTHKGGYKGNLMQTFQKLLICRDAYWKIAGDWKPDWNTIEHKYIIYTSRGEIVQGKNWHTNSILVFPTEEMRNAFYKNFKDLIERCKELL